ncbi:MAG: Gfo/Idh/MocA family oxidoreductase [Planctomycetota bacterium]
MTGDGPLRTAVVGVGRLGSFHARVHAELPEADLRYVVDVDADRAGRAAGEHGGRPATDHREIIDEVDAVSIATPTSCHHEIARAFLEAGVSVLVEKPMTVTVGEADELIAIAADRGATLQVGHIERFNPAYRAIRDVLHQPAFIECHRLSPYPFRSTDVSVVLDLMIHDLDLILDVAGVEPDSVEGAGIPILSQGTDIANARLRFRTPTGRPGCIANVTASRVSPRSMRRLRVFQPDAYISMDFLVRKVHIFRRRDDVDLSAAPEEELAALAAMPPEAAFGRLLKVRSLDLSDTDALRDEVRAFLRAVLDGSEPPVTGEHGRRALALAVEIDRDIQRFVRARTES